MNYYTPAIELARWLVMIFTFIRLRRNIFALFTARYKINNLRRWGGGALMRFRCHPVAVDRPLSEPASFTRLVPSGRRFLITKFVSRCLSRRLTIPN